METPPMSLDTSSDIWDGGAQQEAVHVFVLPRPVGVGPMVEQIPCRVIDQTERRGIKIFFFTSISISIPININVNINTYQYQSGAPKISPWRLWLAYKYFD